MRYKVFGIISLIALNTVSLAYAGAPQEADVEHYQSLFDSQVREGIDIPASEQERLLSLASEQMAKHNAVITEPQFGLIVDRGIHQQKISVVLMSPSINDWQFIGQTKISTGKPGRKEHFKTPVGVFVYDGSILGYRALGTYNQNHIRGIGVKGMRVWDFGWQTTEDWRTHDDTMQIRMEMHATDPDVLAPRFGRPDSEGCIRIPADLNVFIDHYGVLDKEVEQLAETSKASKALLGPAHIKTGLAGDTVVIVDGG